VIRAVHADGLLDPATGETTREALVVIDDGRVTHAGRRANAQVPRDAETIDASGLTILPGLIDCHVHLTALGEGLDFARELTTPPTLELMRAVRAARRTLDAGFTAVRDAAGSPAGVLDEIRAAVEEASVHGLKVMAHAQANAGIKNALKGGVATIEHGIWLDGDAIEMMLDGGHALIPTLVAPQWVIRHADAGKMPAYAAGKARDVIKDHTASIHMAVEAGVKIAFGTDTGVGPHGSNGEEFLLMQQLGMKPIDCIRSATTVAAQTIGMKGVGTLAPGSWGDLIGVPGDPLADLTLLSKPDNVHLVMKGGDVVKSQS